MDELNFGIIGAGFWGQYQIAAWREVPGARPVALCDIDRARAQMVAEKFGIPNVYSDAEEMLHSLTLDFVDIAAGPEVHAPLVLLAAGCGVPVICQKPMALDYATCERMVQVCRETGTTFLIHENFRWQDPMRRVKALLNSGRIGRPYRAHIQFSHGGLDMFDPQPYLYTQPHFALFDMGPHLLDLARFFFGEPHSLYSREFKVNERFVGEDIVSIVLGYDRLTCHCELTWRTTGYEVFVEGADGTVTWHPPDQITIETDDRKETEKLTPSLYPWADSRYGFAHPSIVVTNAHLLSALGGDCVAETTGEDNLKTMRLVDLVLQSEADDRVVPA